MGQVDFARDLRDKRLVAIKVLAHHLAAGWESASSLPPGLATPILGLFIALECVNILLLLLIPRTSSIAIQNRRISFERSRIS